MVTRNSALLQDDTATAQPEAANAPNIREIDVMDDGFRIPGGTIDYSPLCVNPKASPRVLACGAQARAHRLLKVVEDMSQSDNLNDDSLLAISCYLQELTGLADAVVDALAYQPTTEAETA
jgi:hypothetical protein